MSERLYELAHAPGVIAFTTNHPEPDSECTKEFETCLQSVIADGLSQYFIYDSSNGRISFRRAIVEYLAQQGLATTPEDVIVTSGAQQAIELVIRLLVPHGSPVIVERPTYYGVINALRSGGARILEVPLESDGMDIEKLEAHLSRHRPRLIYTNPTFQNPTGRDDKHRKAPQYPRAGAQTWRVNSGRRPNSELRFAGSPVPSIRALSETGDNVFYVRGFGKVFLPGTRLGYVVTPAHARRALLGLKAHSDLHTNGIMQEAMARFLARKNYPKILNG